MTPDGALARELADKLQHRVICVGQFNGIDIDPDGKMVTLAECDELIALLRKWPEPDKDAARYRYLRSDAVIDTDGPDGMGYEHVQLVWGSTEQNKRRYRHEDAADWLDAAIDAAMTASPQEER